MNQQGSHTTFLHISSGTEPSYPEARTRMAFRTVAELSQLRRSF